MKAGHERGCRTSAHLLLMLPILLEAERYDRGKLVHLPGMTADHAHSTPAVTGDEWS